MNDLHKLMTKSGLMEDDLIMEYCLAKDMHDSERMGKIKLMMSDAQLQALFAFLRSGESRDLDELTQSLILLRLGRYKYEPKR